MPKVKNVSGVDRLLDNRLVLKGAVIDVPAGAVYGLTCQEPNWAPADAEARAEHDAAVAALSDDVEQVDESPAPRAKSRTRRSQAAQASESASPDPATDNDPQEG